MKGKLRWYYSCMNAGKTANLLMKSYQFEQAGVNTILLKSSFDTRDEGVIKSRAIKESKPCYTFDNETNLYDMLKGLVIKCDLPKTVVFIDEIQFATPSHIVQIWEFAKEFKIDVYTFGLKTRADNELFEPVQNLLIYADTIEELKSKCKKCDNKATTHLMLIDNVPVVDYSNSLQVGDVNGEIRYESLCQCCRKKIVNSIK